MPVRHHRVKRRIEVSVLKFKSPLFTVPSEKGDISESVLETVFLEKISAAHSQVCRISFLDKQIVPDREPDQAELIDFVAGIRIVEKLGAAFECVAPVFCAQDKWPDVF